MSLLLCVLRAACGVVTAAAGVLSLSTFSGERIDSIPDSFSLFSSFSSFLLFDADDDDDDE